MEKLFVTIKPLGILILTLFPFILYAQDCDLKKGDVEKKLREKANGWKFISSTLVNYNDNGCSKRDYFFVFNPYGELLINKREINCKRQTTTKEFVRTTYQIIMLNNGKYGIRINEFSYNIDDVVMGAVKPDEVMQKADFEIKCDENKIFLRGPLSSKNRFENSFE